MHFAEEHCFGCASALHDCVNEYGYPTSNKTFTNRLITSITSLDGKDLMLTSWRRYCSFTHQ